jgi:3-deoxy-D-manno-octulosonate 8-phosphate phosphatase (KDO 8-P phosphatase)
VHVNTIIDAVVMDIDGVLTDGTFTLDANSVESKTFCFLDVMGISIGKSSGLQFGIISGENTPVAHAIAAKLKIDRPYLGIKQKDEALCDYSARTGIPLKRICYVGDDINDLPALRLAGISAAPINGHASVLASVSLLLKARGGAGAVRELIDHLLNNNRPTP